jgi:hypothetical protein
MAEMRTGTEKGPDTEIGSMSGATSGWNTFGGGDGIERVPELMWPNSVQAYHAMMNDAQANSLMHGLLLPIRAYRWYIDENGANPNAVNRISDNYNLPVGKLSMGEEETFLRRRTQRRFSFDKHLEDALRALQYGHYFFEQVGEILPDNQWHLRKLGIRPPRTITEINVAKDGSLDNIVQGFQYPNPIKISINRLVAYVWDREGADWTGRSILRPIYRNYIVKDRVLRVGAINIERAGGIPFVEAPEGASAEQIRDLDNLARRFRVGEGAGAALPHGAQLKFASAANGDGAVAYLKQQNEEMARAFLQMVNMLGQTNSGSRALGDTFHDILRIAQFTIAKWFCDLFNEHVIEDDIDWNEGPDEEYAPLLRFDAGMQDPMAGFNEKLAEDAADPGGSGLKAPDDVKAMLGHHPANLTRRRHRAEGQQLRGGSTRDGEGGRVQAEIVASPLSLPPRPLRRNPYAHEVQAQVDFAALDSTFETGLGHVANEVRMARSFQIDELRDAIIAAQGDLEALSEIKTGVSASDRIYANLQLIAMLAADQAVQEASRQGVQIDRPALDGIQASLRERADAVDALIREDITASARRESIRLTGGGLSPQEVAEQTHTFLVGLVGAAMMDMLGGAIQSSMNEGRKLVFQRDGREGTIFASELLDSNTCTHCVAIDGMEYASMAEAERDYPTGHYKDCDGRERCRGTLVKRYDTE